MQITGGIYNSRKVKAPEYENIEPTLSKVRQGIFNALLSLISAEGKVFFDMFSGSGIMSLEAISRGFKVISFEKDKKTAFAIKQAFASLNLKPDLYVGDSLKSVIKTGMKADVIFIDPPYDSDLYEKSLKIILDNRILKDGGIIILEHPVDKEIDIKGFELVKAKKYADKQISYLQYLN
ncbi:16S rRNA (guanine(966)-N(2))-methyltransferase RsmD [bacterium]|nr:16S rRNA (guanine(966)-N(2))-methyltransferase RsmD [bacterium]